MFGVNTSGTKVRIRPLALHHLSYDHVLYGDLYLSSNRKFKKITKLCGCVWFVEVCNTQVFFVVQIHFKGINFTPEYFRTYIITHYCEEIEKKFYIKKCSFLLVLSNTNKILIVNYN